MKVLDLCCPASHRFEGWFGSEADYESQSTQGLVECPLCGDRAITRLPSAPRVHVSRQRDVAVAPAQQPAASSESRSVDATLQATWLAIVRHVIANTDDVGARFAEEARKIHYGEAKERAIRGRATAAEAQALSDEGIDVTPLPIPDALSGPVQ